jgi:hypothetical protein
MVDDPPRELRTLYGKEGEEWWAKLGPARRAAFNVLRQQRCLPPYVEPGVDLSPKPTTPTPKPFDKPSPLALALVRGDASEEAWQALLVETAARLAVCDRAERPAHRPKTLSRRIAEAATVTLLRIWDRLPPEQRWSLRTVREKVLEDFGISRSEALKLLKKVRARSSTARARTPTSTSS